MHDFPPPRTNANNKRHPIQRGPHVVNYYLSNNVQVDQHHEHTTKKRKRCLVIYLHRDLRSPGLYNLNHARIVLPEEVPTVAA